MNSAVLVGANSWANVDFTVEGKLVRIFAGSSAVIPVDGRSCRWSVSGYVDHGQVVLLKDCRLSTDTLDAPLLNMNDGSPARRLTSEPPVEQLEIAVGTPYHLGHQLTPAQLLGANGTANVDFKVAGKLVRIRGGARVPFTIDGRTCQLSTSAYVDARNMVAHKDCREPGDAFDPGAIFPESSPGLQYLGASPKIQKVPVKVGQPFYMGRPLRPAILTEINGHANVDFMVDAKLVRIRNGSSHETKIDGMPCQLKTLKYVDARQMVPLKRCTAS